MKDAVIVSTARTPIGKAYRGAFNNTEAPTLGAHAIREAVARAGIERLSADTDPLNSFKTDVFGVCFNPAGEKFDHVGQATLHDKWIKN